METFFEGEKNVKHDAILEILKTNPGKSVIFSYSAGTVIPQLESMLIQNGYRVAKITGGVTGKQPGLKISKRGYIKDQFNNGDIDVLLITKAGMEGIDLKGTKNIILYEPVWNKAIEEQVIGRGVRRGSHTMLPQEDRYVNVWRLSLVKPDVLDSTDKKPTSVDQKIYEKMTKKENINDDFYKLIQDVDISKQICK